jgi:carboxymethylenebutenolidase
LDPLSSLNVYQRYVIEEFAEDYKEQEMPRRELLRRALLITGSVPLAASVLLALGCGDSDDAESPTPAATTAPTAPAAGGATTPPAARTDGITVQPNDPAIEAQDVRFPGPASEIIAYLARPRASGSYPGLIVIHENRGLNEHTKDVARRYAKENFAALAVDLTSRRGGTQADNAVNAANLTGMSAPRPEELTADLMAGVGYLKQQSFVRANALGVTGFCFGGGMAWELAVASPDIKAAAPYYGPATNVMERLGNTQAAILAVYGGNDARITGQSPQVEERLKGAGKTVEIKVYDGANHAFFNDTGNSYNPQAAQQAWQETLAWFRRHLSG